MSENRVIGRDGRLPWYIPRDFEWFRRHTLGHPVIMGRKTFESIGRVLPKRTNIIVTTRPDYRVDGAAVCHSFERALEEAAVTGTDEAFVIGGSSIFEQGLASADRIYLTLIHMQVDGDSYFPHFDESLFETVFEETHDAKLSGSTTGDSRSEGMPGFTFYILERRVEPQAG